MSRLAVFVDGAPMPEGEARAFWARFSAHMEEHRGDLAGFARVEGYASVHPEMRGGAPALIVSRTAAQLPYANAPSRPPGAGPASGGSRAPQPVAGPPNGGTPSGPARRRKR